VKFQIGIENNVEGRALAWALEHPGCFVYEADAQVALAEMPGAIEGYAAWIASYNNGETWVEAGEIELQVTETWEVYQVSQMFDLPDEDYEVNAWFLYDWKPLSHLDVERGLKLLAWSRADLLEAVSGLDAQALAAERPGERWSIAGILRHVGGAEWWYLDRLGLAFPRDQVPGEAFERLSVVRQHLVEVLPGLVGSTQVLGVSWELWSPRKLLRRALWHERDHTMHIRKLR
jgi:hypothetical protein